MPTRPRGGRHRFADECAIDHVGDDDDPVVGQVPQREPDVCGIERGIVEGVDVLGRGIRLVGRILGALDQRRSAAGIAKCGDVTHVSGRQAEQDRIPNVVIPDPGNDLDL